MPKVTVNSTTLIKGGYILAGTTVDVDDATAESWIARGIAEAHQDAPQATESVGTRAKDVLLTPAEPKRVGRSGGRTRQDG